MNDSLKIITIFWIGISSLIVLYAHFMYDRGWYSLFVAISGYVCLWFFNREKIDEEIKGEKNK